ncbi:hypothetical protein QNH47_06220 [Virgibacillus halodenitrificans]|uniref:hypothetical protein n=1 Tax=Virgibacillus halodenitrificans TaxID=1482 RepID=UPI0024C0380C|nr:hypothetical protein [Virgibacillus halodenitrificans]WHX27448.1 hypothetical protein QNH47_06220 [Virgibacillus halodenitrificans]
MTIACIYNENTYHGAHYSTTVMMTADKQGNVEPLVTDLTLTIEPGGEYRLTNGQGAVLRQGQAGDVFEVVDSMPIRIDTDKLTVHTPDYKGLYVDYEQKYGHGRIGVERTHKRKFQAYTDRGSNAIGIVEYRGKKTRVIHSLHMGDGDYSNKDKAVYLADYLQSLLFANEVAHVSGANFAADRLPLRYNGIVRLWGSGYKEKFEQERLLHDDAIKRGTTITERLAKQVEYMPEGVFDGNGKGVKFDGEETKQVVTQ